MTWIVLSGERAAFCDVQLPPQALNDVPHRQDAGLTVIRHDYRSWRILRDRGLLVPSPLAHYAWGGTRKPRTAQRRACEFMLENRRGCVLRPMRAGKTLAALWTTDYMMRENALRRVLIVAPSSTCTHVWQRALFTDFPHRISAVCKGDARKKQRIAMDKSVEYVIVNYESLHIVADFLPDVDAVVVDEATHVKNVQTRVWKSLNSIAGPHKAQMFLWLLTATPNPQAPTDIYGLLRLLRPKYMSFGQWRDMTMLNPHGFRWVPKEGAENTIAAYLQPAIKVDRSDCYDDSGVQIVEYEFDLTPQQVQLCDRLRKEAIAELAGVQITAANAAVVLAKQMQVQCGGVYAAGARGERTEHQVSAEPFFDAIEELVHESDGPVLIFASYRTCASGIAAYLAKYRYDVGLITGDTPQEERSRLFNAVQGRALHALVAVPKTMTYGIDLYEARTVIWASPPTSNIEYIQANGRVINPHGRTDVGIYQMIGSKLTRMLFNRLESKDALQCAVLALISN